MPVAPGNRNNFCPLSAPPVNTHTHGLPQSLANWNPNSSPECSRGWGLGEGRDSWYSGSAGPVSYCQSLSSGVTTFLSWSWPDEVQVLMAGWDSASFHSPLAHTWNLNYAHVSFVSFYCCVAPFWPQRLVQVQGPGDVPVRSWKWWMWYLQSCFFTKNVQNLASPNAGVVKNKEADS